MKLNYAGVDKDNIKGGLDLSSINSTTRLRRIKSIYEKKPSNMLDWLDLPFASDDILDRIESVGRKIAKKYDNFIVLGIGGSALGIKMLQNTFIDSLHKDIGIKVVVCDNIDSDSFITLLDGLNLKKTCFNVITKSGSTSETLAQMSLVLGRYERKRIDPTSHFVVTTTAGNDLWDFALDRGFETFSIPTGVGGRFSVLSAVGLLPASVMGIDIRGLLSGAVKSFKNSSLDDSTNIAYTCAHINYTYLKAGLTNLVTMPYSDRLALLPDFFAQLWAESLGKRVDKKGNEVYTGQTPIKTIGVTDQHSQLQLYSEGIKDKLIMFFTVGKNHFDETIECENSVNKHLLGTTLKTLLDYEYESTAYSLTTLNRPNYTIMLDTITEESVGELIFMLEMMTAYMGEMLGIDTYDQPGVELSKIYTKGMLGLKGYEDKGKEIKAFANAKKKYFI